MLMSLKIVSIVDEYQVIVNAGKKQGIEKGTTFNVLSKPITIVDEESNESLGDITLNKATIKAVKIFDDMCICEDSDNHAGYITSKALQDATKITGGLSPFDDRIHVSEVHKKLNIDIKDLAKSLSNNAMSIRIGDLVEKN